MERTLQGRTMVEVKLVVVGGGTEGDEFSATLPTVLGRSREASLPLPHPLVSRLHCEIFSRDERVFVRDLGSTNGTFVGSERVEGEMLVEHGSLLTIGTVTFRVLHGDMPLSGSPTEVFSESNVHQAELENQQSDTSSITRLDTGKVGVPKTTKHSSTSRNRQRAK